VSTTEPGSGGEDVERVSADEGEEDVPMGSAEEVGGWSEDPGGGIESGDGGSLGDLGGGGWTESGGQTESGAEIGGGAAGDIGSEPGEASLGGGMGEESEERP
jgi:hypothetical protein